MLTLILAWLVFGVAVLIVAAIDQGDMPEPRDLRRPYRVARVLDRREARR